MKEDVVLEARDLTVRYGTNTALRQFNFCAHRNEVTGVIGPNGSGKTTFLNALTGSVPYESGSIFVMGNRLDRVSASSMHNAGVSRTFQNLELINDLSVESNVKLGAASTVRATMLEALLGAPRSRRESKLRSANADAALNLLGLSSLAHRHASELSYGMRRRVEVARALASSPKILLLDEPTAGMGPSESLEFSRLVQHLARELGISVVLIEHDMSVVRAVCNTVYVLSTGSLIDNGPPREVLDNPEVRRVYLGDFEVHNA